MFLSALLFGARSTPGKQWIGKHRRTWKMTATRRKNTRDREKLVREVEEVLSRPYLSLEQEHRHSMERRKEYVPMFMRRQRNKWLKREQLPFSSLVKHGNY
ncbi:Ribosomal protein 63, mitochondrial [Geodia barretti]|uniref:Ribosomal protein 63, mitochondrial n=1 Tax=Geodia barretti TaxID=519541 RepID=A0AA35WVV3_GEOBA|nr:Ribosomal protein 63, mitochondrial [Geodia barretti]